MSGSSFYSPEVELYGNTYVTGPRYAGTRFNIGGQYDNSQFNAWDPVNFALNNLTGADDFYRAWRALGRGDLETDWGQLGKSLLGGAVELSTIPLTVATGGIWGGARAGAGAFKAANAIRNASYARYAGAMPRAGRVGAFFRGTPKASIAVPGTKGFVAQAAQQGFGAGLMAKSPVLRFLLKKYPQFVIGTGNRRGGVLAATRAARANPSVRTVGAATTEAVKTALKAGIPLYGAYQVPRLYTGAANALNRSNINQGRMVLSRTEEEDRARRERHRENMAAVSGRNGTSSQQSNLPMIISNMENEYNNAVGNLRGKFQLAETDAERDRIRYILADLEAQKSAGLAAIADLYTSQIGQVGQARERSIADTARAVSDVEQLYGDTVSGLEGRLEQVAADVSDIAPGLQTFEPPNEYAQALESLSPIEQTYSQRIGDISADALAARQEGMRGEQAAQAGELERLALAQRSAALLAHNAQVQDRINAERMAMMQMSGRSSGGGSASEPIYSGDLSRVAMEAAMNPYIEKSTFLTDVAQRYGNIPNIQEILQFMGAEFDRVRNLELIRQEQAEALARAQIQNSATNRQQ